MHLVFHYFHCAHPDRLSQANGWEGLEKFLAGGFDVVVTNRAMLGMSGANRRPPSNTRVAPDRSVIMLTGFGDVMQDVGQLPEAVDLVAEPATLADLRQALAQVSAG